MKIFETNFPSFSPTWPEKKTLSTFPLHMLLRGENLWLNGWTFSTSPIFIKKYPHLTALKKALSKWSKRQSWALCLFFKTYDTDKQRVNPPWLGKFLKLQSKNSWNQAGNCKISKQFWNYWKYWHWRSKKYYQTFKVLKKILNYWKIPKILKLLKILPCIIYDLKIFRSKHPRACFWIFVCL